MEMHLTDLNDDERAALKAYKSASDSPDGQSNCFDLNRDLRSGLWIRELSLPIQNIARSLDGIFARGPRLKQNTTVFRGVGTRCHLPLNEIGKRFRNLEYWSTTLYENAVDTFLNPVGSPAYGAILVLHLPIGFPAYDMETLEGVGGHEGEFLLPRGVLWRVVSASVIPDDEVSKFIKPKFKNIVKATLCPESYNSPSE